MKNNAITQTIELHRDAFRTCSRDPSDKYNKTLIYKILYYHKPIHLNYL